MVFKLIGTVVIVLVVVAFLLPYLPFMSVFSKFGASNTQPASFFDNVNAGNIEFIFTADKYNGFQFASVGKNVTAFGDTNGYAQNIEISTDGVVNVEDYSGIVAVTDKIILNGSVTRVIVPGVKFKTDKIYLETTGMETGNILLKRMKIDDVSGSITVKGSETKFAGTIVISDFSSDFSIVNNTLSISGKAAAIEIPSAGLKFT